MDSKIAFARDRKLFINKMEDSLSPALEHHYLLLLVERAGFSRMRTHWKSELAKFLMAFGREFGKQTHMSDVGEWRAYLRAVVETKDTDKKIRNLTMMHFTQTFEKELQGHPKKVPVLLHTDADAFWKVIDGKVRTILGWTTT